MLKIKADIYKNFIGAFLTINGQTAEQREKWTDERTSAGG